MQKPEEPMTTGGVTRFLARREMYVVPETVRVWVRSGAFAPAARTSSGINLFRVADVERLIERRRAKAASRE